MSVSHSQPLRVRLFSRFYSRGSTLYVCLIVLILNSLNIRRKASLRQSFRFGVVKH